MLSRTCSLLFRHYGPLVPVYIFNYPNALYLDALLNIRLVWRPHHNEVQIFEGYFCVLGLTILTTTIGLVFLPGLRRGSIGTVHKYAVGLF